MTGLNPAMIKTAARSAQIARFTGLSRKQRRQEDAVRHGWMTGQQEQQDSSSNEARGVISTNSRASQLGWCNVGGVLVGQSDSLAIGQRAVASSPVQRNRSSSLSQAQESSRSLALVQAKAVASGQGSASRCGTTSRATTSLEDGQQSSNIGIGYEEGLGQEGLG